MSKRQQAGARHLETVLSIATLAGLIWIVRTLRPKAVHEEDRFGLVCVMLTLLMAVVVWFLAGGVGVN